MFSTMINNNKNIFKKVRVWYLYLLKINFKIHRLVFYHTIYSYSKNNFDFGINQASVDVFCLYSSVYKRATGCFYYNNNFIVLPHNRSTYLIWKHEKIRVVVNDYG